jgi:hypothetical protein
MKISLSSFAVGLLLASCGTSQFQTTAGSKGNKSKKDATESVNRDSTPKVAGSENVAGEKSVDFSFGPTTSANDLLFIFDNSSSMKSHLEKVKAGFEGLSSADWFGDVKIGVMTTMPADPQNLAKTHSGVSTYKGIDAEPGFLSLVSAKALEVFKKVGAADKISAYVEPLCNDEWFSPDAVNSNKKRCLSVALQNPHHGVGCEAGMTALSQLVSKREKQGSKLFRKGAFAQVVFVSDAQDPGCENNELAKTRPSSQVLRNLVLEKSELAGLKFHGVLTVPNGAETKETKDGRNFGFPYNTLINENKGIILDITSSTNYSEFAKTLAKSSLPQPVFSFPSKVSKVIGVKVDGKELPANKIQLSADGKSVRLTDLAPTTDVKIQVRYLP